MQTVQSLVNNLDAIQRTLAQSIFDSYDFGGVIEPENTGAPWTKTPSSDGYLKSFSWAGHPCTFRVLSDFTGGKLVVCGLAKKDTGGVIGKETVFIDGVRQHSAEDAQRFVAEAAFANYDFGSDIIVGGTGGWETTTEVNKFRTPVRDEWVRAVYVEVEGQEASEKLTFVVRFEHGSSTPHFVYARDSKGNDIGTTYKNSIPFSAHA